MYTFENKHCANADADTNTDADADADTRVTT